MTLRMFAAVVLVAIVAAPALAGPPAFGVTAIQSCNSADGSGLTVGLSWSNASGAVSYSVLRGNTVVASGLTGNSFNDTTAPYGFLTYVVRAYNSAGFFTESNSFIISTSFPSCGNPQIAQTGYCAGASPAAHFQWNLSTDGGSLTVQRDGTTIDTIPGTSRTYDDRPAPTGTHTYVFSSGQSTLTFNNVSVPSCGSVPTAPTGGTAAATCSNSRVIVQVDWTLVAGASTYRVYRGNTFIGASGSTTFQEYDVPPGQYTYYVQAVSKAGTAESSGIPVTVGPNVCTPPGSFTASASQICSSGNPTIHLTWTASSGATSYTVDRDGAPQQSGITGTSFDDPNVTPGQTRNYTVIAFNPGGSTSAPTVTVHVTSCVTPPPAPTLSASTFCSANKPAVHLTWTGSAGATYTILRNGLSIGGPQSATTYDDTTVATQQYTYTIRASNGSGTSDSNNVTIAVPADSCPPAAPTLSANATCNGGAPVVALLWSVSTGASSYTVLRNGASIGSMTATSYNDSNVTPGQTYTYMVRAVNAAGSADSNSAQVSIAFDACGMPPGSFTLSATPLCDTTGTPATAVRLTWTSSAGATSYAILRGGSQITTTTGTTYVDRNVSGSIQYVVRASNNIGTAQATASTNVDPNLCDGFTPAPDLGVASVSAPATASPGSTIRVQYTLLNRGTAAGSSTVRVRLGSGTQPSDSDLLLASKPSPTLAPGASIADSQLITLPASLAPGTYYAFVSIDSSTARSNEIAVAAAGCGASCGTLVADTASATVPVVFMLSAPPCEGATVLWTFGDESSSTAPAATHTYAVPGTYVWSVTVSNPSQSNAQSCNASGTIVITESAAAAAQTGEALSQAMTFTPAPVKPVIDFSIFEQIDIRVGTIVLVEDMEQSKKLARLRVDFGDRVRTIIAGLKQERADLSELIGKQALFVVNLEPRRMAGELSEGMLFDLGYADGVVPALAVPERPLPNGTRAG